MHLYPIPPDYHPITLAVEARPNADGDSLTETLSGIARDGQAQVQPTSEPSHFRFGLMSDLHATLLTEALAKLDASIAIGAPAIGYREMISVVVEVDYTRSVHLGPKSDFARVKLRYEPDLHSMTNTFENTADVRSVPAEYVPGVERGYYAAIESGPLRGCPLVACRATLLDGASHEIDSSVIAFDIASRIAFRSEAVKAAMILLEPIARLWVVCGEDHIGTVIGQLNACRGQICETTEHAGALVVEALVPVGNTFNLERTLKDSGATALTSQLAGLAELAHHSDLNFRPAIGMRA